MIRKKNPLAVSLGASLFGASSSLIIVPIQNRMNYRRFKLYETIDTAILNGLESALIVPIRMLVNLQRMKIYGQIFIGAATGVTYNFIESKFGNRNHSASLAVMMGIIGGLSTHITNFFSQLASNEIFRALSRIGLEMFIALVINCAIEIYHHSQKESLFWGNFLSQFAVIFVTELGQHLTKRTSCFNKITNLDLIRGNLNKDDVKNTRYFESQILKIHAEINSLPQRLIAENLDQVRMYNNFHLKLSELKFHRRVLSVLNHNNTLINHTGQKREQIFSFNLPKTTNEIKRLEKLTISMRPRLMGENNMHFLIGPRTRQIAVDLTPRDVTTGRRGAQRVIFEEYYGKFIYTDHTLNHNYRDCRITSRNFIIDPSDLLRYDHYNNVFFKNAENVVNN